MLEEVTTVYHGDDRWTPTPPPTALERSLETSDRTESGIYCDTPTVTQGTHSTGRSSGRQSRGISSLAQTESNKRKSTLTKAEKPSVMVKGQINHDASTNFRAPDEPAPRAPLHVINAVVKRDSPPVQATAANSNTSGGGGDGGGACLVAGGNMQPFPYQITPATTTMIPKPSELSLSLDPVATLTSTPHFYIASSELEEDDTEKDVASGSPGVEVSAPIDIPSRNTSCATLEKPSATKSHGSDTTEVEGPPQNVLRKQISNETSSSDSSSSNGSFLNLDANDTTTSTMAKDLSHIPPARQSWKRFLDQWKSRLTFILDSTEANNDVSERGKPLYTFGCGIKM